MTSPFDARPGLVTERAIWWQQWSAVQYAAARRAIELGWLYEATGHQITAATISQLARDYLFSLLEDKET